MLSCTCTLARHRRTKCILACRDYRMSQYTRARSQARSLVNNKPSYLERIYQLTKRALRRAENGHQHFFSGPDDEWNFRARMAPSTSVEARRRPRFFLWRNGTQVDQVAGRTGGSPPRHGNSRVGRPGMQGDGEGKLRGSSYRRPGQPSSDATMGGRGGERIAVI